MSHCSRLGCEHGAAGTRAGLPSPGQGCPEGTRGEAAGSAQQDRAACLAPAVGAAPRPWICRGGHPGDGPCCSGSWEHTGTVWSDASRTHTPEFPSGCAQGAREAGEDAGAGQAPQARWAPENPSSTGTPSPGVAPSLPLLPDQSRRTQHSRGLRRRWSWRPLAAVFLECGVSSAAGRQLRAMMQQPRGRARCQQPVLHSPRSLCGAGLQESHTSRALRPQGGLWWSQVAAELCVPCAQ